MGEATASKFTWIGWSVLGALALVSLAALLTGGTIYGIAVADWADHDYLFQGFMMITWAVGLLAAGVIAFGLLLAGVILRFLPWKDAPLASLGLAIISTAFLIATFLIYSQTGNSDDSIEVVLLQGACILGLFILSLPPFLHWFFARRPDASAIQAAGASGTAATTGKEGADALR